MRRTTVFLDPSLDDRLKEAARQEGRPFAAMVREAITRYLDTREVRVTPLPPITGAFASGVSDTSERVDELLWRDPHS